MRSVLLGVAGCESAGRLERSIESEGEWRRFMPVVGDGVEMGDIVMAAMSLILLSPSCSVGVIGSRSPLSSVLLLE